MSQDLIIQIFREVIKTGLIVMAPALLISIVVGLIVSIFQAATQIHEMTLVFVPKILAIATCMIVLFPWMLNILVTYTTNLLTNIPVYVR
ncbi:MAG TPA: flagellar biosynthesis protein FliQ [Syntrophorhabdaceae bacterium]|jgi:flagellar biosynthetic protein FliQ|nr:flagellar biosynthesis protein FliQ [Syntrophorhabdaceae bacterium]MDI9560334.1 flagellar biosynthesis protein FliQ [Pseudomonadota bacterium]OQC48968.1 MAG: Flagellar biosynthetic protein FliQ [Deltaproteobacteria bacterium ADurb.Bin026]HNQ63502.1 flagellar biosynthesis protein FliQ [Syntrophorhabdaceae bacterium]HOF58229.1 flagellar biosynthesis protein FliQ [Syntrophorhabdaceae bacterium]